MSPVKVALTCHAFHLPPETFGDAAVAENVPSGFVITVANPSEPLPSNDIVFPPSPAPDGSANLPVTVMSLPHATHFILSNVKVDVEGGGRLKVVADTISDGGLDPF